MTEGIVFLKDVSFAGVVFFLDFFPTFFFLSGWIGMSSLSLSPGTSPTTLSVWFVYLIGSRTAFLIFCVCLTKISRDQWWWWLPFSYEQIELLNYFLGSNKSNINHNHMLKTTARKSVQTREDYTSCNLQKRSSRPGSLWGSLWPSGTSSCCKCGEQTHTRTHAHTHTHTHMTPMSHFCLSLPLVFVCVCA